MQQRFRLTGKQRFSQIHQEGRSIANNLLVLRVLPNDLAWSRFGFVISKRIGNAVVRNRMKRRLREVIRQAPVPGGWDAIFIARRGSSLASYPQLQSSVLNLLQRTRLITPGSVAQVSPGQSR
jgi:ribonuclease P protein component